MLRCRGLKPAVPVSSLKGLGFIFQTTQHSAYGSVLGYHVTVSPCETWFCVTRAVMRTQLSSVARVILR